MSVHRYEFSDLPLGTFHPINIHLERVQILVAGKLQDLRHIHPDRLGLSHRLGNTCVPQPVGSDFLTRNLSEMFHHVVETIRGKTFPLTVPSWWKFTNKAPGVAPLDSIQSFRTFRVLVGRRTESLFGAYPYRGFGPYPAQDQHLRGQVQRLQTSGARGHTAGG